MGDKGETKSRASNARRNENVTDGKTSRQRATQRKRERREVERAVRDETEEQRSTQPKRDGRDASEEEGNNCAANRNSKLNQTN